MPEKVDHTHGDTGTKPDQDLNFQDGDYPDPEVFDWFWSEVTSAINDHADLLDDIDSDGDGVVDKAETADEVKGNDIDSDSDGVVDEADSANEYKGNDIDSDGDGVVDKADEAKAFEVRSDDPSDPSEGQVWFVK